MCSSDLRRCRMLRLGALRMRSSDSLVLPAAHLRDIHALVRDLINEFQPNEVAVESVFTALNVKTALSLAEVRGVVLLAAAQAGIPSFSYSPRQVKAMVAGYGQAGKEQVQKMVRAMLQLSETPEPADAADALAVALCHVHVAEGERRRAAGFSRAAGKLNPAVSAKRKPGAALPRIFAR